MGDVHETLAPVRVYLGLNDGITSINCYFYKIINTTHSGTYDIALEWCVYVYYSENSTQYTQGTRVVLFKVSSIYKLHNSIASFRWKMDKICKTIESVHHAQHCTI